jgi:hypothetical protein
LLGFYQKRQARIVELLRAEGAQTPGELAPKIFPRVKPNQHYLVLSEVMGNLEVLEEAGSVSRAERGGRVYFGVE